MRHHIDIISHLLTDELSLNRSEPLRTEVRIAFASSVRVIWQVTLGLAGAAFLLTIFMEQITLTKEVDKNWGLAEKVVGRDLETQVGEVKR